MNEALALIGYAFGIGVIGAHGLRRATWPERVPRLGVAAWQALSLSVLMALLLAGLAVTVPAVQIGTGLADLLHACVLALRAQYATPGGAVLHITGAVATSALATRTAYMLVTGMARARRERGVHLAGLRLAARPAPNLKALILDHPGTAAYCLPGKGGTVVLTSAAVAVLDGEELAAVLAHERAHLRGRHHLVLALSAALARAVPFLPVFRWAGVEQARLLEMVADDTAARCGSTAAVARALVSLAEGAVPSPRAQPGQAVGSRQVKVPVTLGAAEVAALTRVQRLVDPDQRVGVMGRVVIASSLLVAFAAPVVIAVGPAAAAARGSHCSISTDSASSSVKGVGRAH